QIVARERELSVAHLLCTGIERPLLLDLEHHRVRGRKPVRLSLRAIANRLLDAAADLLLRALRRQAERRIAADLFLHRDGLDWSEETANLLDERAIARGEHDRNPIETGDERVVSAFR